MCEFDSFEEAAAFRSKYFSDCPLKVSIVEEFGRFFIYVDYPVGTSFLSFYEKEKDFINDLFFGDLF